MRSEVPGGSRRGDTVSPLDLQVPALTENRMFFGRFTAKALAVAQSRTVFLLLVAALGLLAVAYHGRGALSLIGGMGRSDAVDLRQKWVEHRYFARRQNPFDVWLQHGPFRWGAKAGESLAKRGPTPLDASLGIADPANPPWSYVPGFLFFWPRWPVVRLYFALCNLVASGILARWAYGSLKAFSTSTAVLAGLAVLSVGAVATVLAVGQYSWILTACLAVVLASDARNMPALSGLALFMALGKPTMSAPFVLAILRARRLRCLATFVGLCAASSAVTWLWIGVDPVELLKQLSLVGQYLAPAGSLSATRVLARSGWDSQGALLVPMAVLGAAFTLAIASTSPRSLLALFGLCSVASRLWTYHYSHDDVVIVFLLIALAAQSLRRPSPLRFAVCILVWVSLAAPGRLVKLEIFQITQYAVWVVGAIVLWVGERDTPLAAIPALSDLPRHRPENS